MQQKLFDDMIAGKRPLGVLFGQDIHIGDYLELRLFDNGHNVGNGISGIVIYDESRFQFGITDKDGFSSLIFAPFREDIKKGFKIIKHIKNNEK